MVLIERKLNKLKERDDIDLIFFKDFDELYHLSQLILLRANADNGRTCIIMFGLDNSGKVFGIKGTEKENYNQLETYMGIFTPSIQYKITSSFNPSDYKIIYMLHIIPKLKRFFFPHRIRKRFESILSQVKMTDFSSSLQDIINESQVKKIIPITSLITVFSPIHLEQFSHYKEESVPLKLNRIVDTIHFFKDRDDLITAINTIEIYDLFLHSTGIFALKAIGRIFNYLILDDDLSREIIIDRLQHLFLLLPEGKSELQYHINIFLRDIIIGVDSIFNLEISNYLDLVSFLNIISTVGVEVDLDKVIREIEYGEAIKNRIEVMEVDNIWDDDLLAKIFVIFVPYFEQNESQVNSIFNQKKVKKNKQKSKLKKQIEQRDRIFRPVKKNRRHDRDTHLAFMMKEYYGFECQSCESKKTSLTTITISHKIPLYFGIDFGGIDRSDNMEVLCRFCHDQYEKKFDKEIFQNPNIVSKEELLNYLKTNFSGNFI